MNPISFLIELILYPLRMADNKRAMDKRYFRNGKMLRKK